MACQIKPMFMAISLVLLAPSFKHGVHGQSQVPCYFIFGDSLADNGNNNILPTKARVNYEPYGIDFPDGPTGRFSNARTSVDIIAQLLGFVNYIPPFATARGREIMEGVNYASGAAGIREESGRTQGARINLNQQIRNHKITISRISNLLGNRSSALTYLTKCIYTVGIGNNDYLNNYFMPQFYPTSRLFTPQQYAIALAQQLSQKLQTLYNDGARKVAVFGAGVIGCTPYALTTFDTNGSVCVDSINEAVQLFNVQLKSLIDELNSNLTEAKFSFIDSFLIGITGSPTDGSIVSDVPCCKVKECEFQCIPFLQPCDNRSQYVFWDAVHTTEIANLAMASRAYQAQLLDDAHPYDISQLAQL